ncbi:unnamed protein product, partial [Polarella glacialis]
MEEATNGSGDAYHELEMLWRGVRDYESLLREPLVNEPWVSDLLHDFGADQRCERLPAVGKQEAFRLHCGPEGGHVFLCPAALSPETQGALLEAVLTDWALPPNRSNLWPPAAPKLDQDQQDRGDVEDRAEEAADVLRSGLTDFIGRKLSYFSRKPGASSSESSSSMGGSVVDRLRWVTLGRQYDWSARCYLEDEPTPLPELLVWLAEDVVSTLPLPTVEDGRSSHSFEAAICNLYHAARRPSDRLGGHRDDVEPDASSPL